MHTRLNLACLILTFIRISLAAATESTQYDDPLNTNYDYLMSSDATRVTPEKVDVSSDYDKASNDDDDEEELDKQLNSYLNNYKQVLLNNQLTIECPLTLHSDEFKFFSKFKFGEIIFYKSVHDFDLVDLHEQLDKKKVIAYAHDQTLYFKLKSKKVFKLLFKKLNATKKNVNRWSKNVLVKNASRFADSGRYYCVYSYKSEYLITGNLYIIYEGSLF